MGSTCFSWTTLEYLLSANSTFQLIYEVLCIKMGLVADNQSIQKIICFSTMLLNKIQVLHKLNIVQRLTNMPLSMLDSCSEQSQFTRTQSNWCSWIFFYACLYLMNNMFLSIDTKQIWNVILLSKMPDWVVYSYLRYVFLALNVSDIGFGLQ